MVGELDLETVRDFATALLIGTLLGIERERHKQADGDVSVGGLRTNTVVKALMVVGLGAPGLRRPVIVGASGIVLLGLAAVLLG